MIPGSNILNMAFRVIAKQVVDYYKYTGRTLTADGLEVSQYQTASPVGGSLQPVPRNLYEQLGLDFNNSYYVFYASSDMLDVQRDVAGDQFAYTGQQYQVLSRTEWFRIDGWTAVLAVAILDGPPGGESYIVDPDGNYITDPDGNRIIALP